jgi:hypothetical protein
MTETLKCRRCDQVGERQPPTGEDQPQDIANLKTTDARDVSTSPYCHCPFWSLVG